MKLILCALSLTLISCLPNRLVPYDYSIEQNNQEAYVEVDSITIAIRNLKIKGDHLVFGMEVENKSSKPIFIHPQKIQKYAHHLSYIEDDQDKIFQEVMSAMSPEQVDQFFEEKKRNAQAAAAFLFIVGAAIITYDALKDEEDNNKSCWTEEDEKESFTRDLVSTTALAATDVLTEVAWASEEKANIELNHLPNELFTKEVIYPGERYYGKLFFRKVEDLKKFHRIVCPLEDKKFLFDFRKATPEEKRFIHEQEQFNFDY